MPSTKTTEPRKVLALRFIEAFPGRGEVQILQIFTAKGSRSHLTGAAWRRMKYIEIRLRYD